MDLQRFCCEGRRLVAKPLEPASEHVAVNHVPCPDVLDEPIPGDGRRVHPANGWQWKRLDDRCRGARRRRLHHVLDHRLLPGRHLCIDRRPGLDAGQPVKTQRRQAAGVGHLKGLEPQFEPLHERFDADQLIGKRNPSRAELLGKEQMLEIVLPVIRPLMRADHPQLFRGPPTLSQPPVCIVDIG